MGDCLLALHDCSLIGLEESPDLLRQSLLLLQKPNNVLLWDTQAQQADVTRRLAFTPAAAAPPTSVKNFQQAVAACELSLLERSGGSVLDCSLPLVSESPAIVGKQLPRKRSKRHAGAAAAQPGPCHACDQQSVQEDSSATAAMASAKVDECLMDSNASTCSVLEASLAICSDSAATTGNTTQQVHVQQRVDSNEHPAERTDPAVAATSWAADASLKSGAPVTTNNELLQALLDDSCASAASLLQPFTVSMTSAGLVSVAGVEDAAGVQDGSYHIIHSSLRASADSSVSEFQGFWHHGTAARSPFSTPHASKTPASSLLLMSASLTDAPSGVVAADAAYTGSTGTAGNLASGPSASKRLVDSLECLSSCDTWVVTETAAEAEPDHADHDAPGSTPAAADAVNAAVEQPQQQQGMWNELLLLLSLDESVSLMQATVGRDLDSSVEKQTNCIHEQQEGLSQAEQLLGPACTEATSGTAPQPKLPPVSLCSASPLPTAAGRKRWVSNEVECARYSDWCPSPTSPEPPDSPTVLMSSPALGACTDGNTTTACGSTKSRSVIYRKPSRHALAAEEAGDLVSSPTQHPVQQQDGGTGSEQQHQPNAIEFSPIRGVTLPSDAGCQVPSEPADELVDACAGLQQQIQCQGEEQVDVQFLSPAGLDTHSNSQWETKQQQAVSGVDNALLLQLLADSTDSWTGILASEQHEGVQGESAATSAAAAESPNQLELSEQQTEVAAGDITADSSHSTGALGLEVPEHPGSSTLSPVASPAPSPVDSVDSFVIAAAGQPYSSMSFSPKHGRALPSILGRVKDRLPQQRQEPVSSSQQWCAYQGLGEMLTDGGAHTPASVMCKNGWDKHAASKPNAAQQHRGWGAGVEIPEPFSAAACSASQDNDDAGKGHLKKWQQCSPVNTKCHGVTTEMHVGQTGSSDNPHQDTAGSAADQRAVTDTAVVQDLTERLAEAELQCAKQQQEVMQARQLAMEKELQLQVLRNALHSSEAEGNSCLDALAAAMDLVSATNASSSVNSSVELDVNALSSPSGKPTAAGIKGYGDACSSLQQLQEQNTLLQHHNLAMQSTLAEAGQQLDLLEARVAELSAEKEAAEVHLAEFNQHLEQQLRQQQQFTQSELDEQQQQHEEEVRQLHDRLGDLSTQLQQAQHELEEKKISLQQVQANLGVCQLELENTKKQLAELQQAMDGRADESAASTEQLHRQVQQLLAAKRELQEANARLVDAEAEYASNMLTLGCKNQELTAQLESGQATNKQLEDTIQQLQAQNDSLSQMCQTLQASALGQGAAHNADGPAHGGYNEEAAAATSSQGVVQPEAGPTPMRRRMAAVTAQLERRCQQLLEEKQQLALQVQQLQQQQPPANAAETVEQHQALMQDLQDQIEHLSACNDELLVQLQDLQCENEQLLQERDHMLDQLSQKEQDLAAIQRELDDRVAEQQQEQQQELMTTVEENAQLTKQCGELQQGLAASQELLTAEQQRCELLQQQLHSTQHAVTETAELQQQLQEAQAESTAADARCQQLQAQVAALQQQLNVGEPKQQQQRQQQQQSCEQQLQLKNTALFARCQELESQVQELQAQQREYEQQAAVPASSSKMDQQQQKQLIAELRARLRDVLALLEEKQELVELQAKQYAAQQADWNQQRDKLAQELQEVQGQLRSLQTQHDQQLTQSNALQQQLSSAKLAKTAAEKEVAAAHQSNKELEEALLKVQNQNQALIDQVVKLQLVDPADSDVCAGAKHHQERTSDAAVQVDIGASPEQAAAVQQLLLLQAQQQLQDMELQNKRAAEKLMDSRARMKELQASMQQQEQQLKLTEEELYQARQLTQKQTGILHAENDQLAQQLAQARKELHALQAAYQQLQAKVLQQQQDLEKQQQMLAEKQQELLKQQQKVQEQQVALEERTAALQASQQLVQGLQQQQTLDKLQVATAAAELQKAKEHAQQLVQAKEQETQAAAALQQQVQQLLQEGRQHEHVTANSEAAVAAAKTREAAVRDELGKSKQQVQLLLQENNTLVVELQQTKVAVDFLEDSVRRLGQHNSNLVQQLKDTMAAAAAASTAAEQAKAGSILELQAVGDGGNAGATATAGPVSPRTLQHIITAATKVNEKNKRLKKRLLALQGVNGS